MGQQWLWALGLEWGMEGAKDGGAQPPRSPPNCSMVLWAENMAGYCDGARGTRPRGAVVLQSAERRWGIFSSFGYMWMNAVI